MSLVHDFSTYETEMELSAESQPGSLKVTTQSQKWMMSRLVAIPNGFQFTD